MSDGLQSAAWGGDITRGFRELNENLRANRKKVIGAGLEVLRNGIVEELSHAGTGRVREHRLPKRKGRRVRTPKGIARAGRASAPGEPPAPDYGKLRGSIQTEYDDTLQKGRVGTNDVRAAALNYGTTRAGKNRKTVILPRPFMEPALKKSAVAMSAAGVSALQLIPIVRQR